MSWRLLLLLAVTLATSAAASPRIDWDRSANVKEAAERLVALQKQGGALGAYKFIVACYKTHSLAERYSKPLEACIAQDYMLTQIMVMVYERLPAETRKTMHAVEPGDLARAFSARVSGVLTQYKMTEQDGLTLRKLVDKDGMPVFLAKTFPDAKSRPENGSGPAER